MGPLDILYTVLIMPLSLAFEAIYMVALRVIGDPGLSIVALSVAMNLLVLPLYMRADKMQERERDVEARLAEGVAHIRATFSGDERSMMLSAYYRQNGYRPTDVLKGSVSLMLEIPFFIAAYMFLSNLQAVRGVGFWVIGDLGAPDGLLELGGLTVNVLPCVMTAINLVSCALFTRGMPAKTKVQLYGMAAFFLVFLYSSPSGLVFYWTLNNLFALVKTIFYKLKNPKRVLIVLAAAAGALIAIYGLFFMPNPNNEKNGIILILTLICFAPFAVKVFKRLTHFTPKEPAYTPHRRVYVAGAVFLTVLTGLLIPSAVISSSPQEFLDVQQFSNPLWFVAKSACLAAGTFLVWMSVFYWLANKRAKLVFETGVWALSVTAVVNYMFFGTGLGTLSNSLQYRNGMFFSYEDATFNAIVVVVLAVGAILFARNLRKAVPRVLAVGSVAALVLSGMNLVTINDSVNQVLPSVESGVEKPKASFELSREGKNVVVLMLDRGIGPYLPYLFAEKPELEQIYDGFTYYANTVSFGGSTNIASPALYGGYEYTPEKINQRPDEMLVTKHNEALRVMPALFDDAGYDVTVCDPSYAGYRFTPDLSIYNDYPNIKTYNTDGMFSNMWPFISESDMRNFFCYALMKSSPLAVQPTLYDDGRYNSGGGAKGFAGNQRVSGDIKHADGIFPTFMNAYDVLLNMPEMTQVTDNGTGGFLMMVNYTAHEPMLLQEPDYVPEGHVDNTEYEAAHPDRFTHDGVTMQMNTPYQVIHYHANMAALLRLGEWLDYLREQGVYDNTRIIIVADHGRALENFPDFMFDDGSDDRLDLEYYCPLFLVKDFDSHGFTTSEEFMTNADTPTMALAGLVENPVNPFTGNRIDTSAKNADDTHVFSSDSWDVNMNHGNVFKEDGLWFSVHDDVRSKENWSVIPDPSRG